MLQTPEVARLTNDIRDSFRIRPNHNPSYVDVADHLTRLTAKQHQIVFGRRGSGKSCLFVHFLHDQEANNGVLPIYLDSDELKRLGYPDLLIRLLLRVFESLPGAKSWWRRLVRRPNAIQNQIDELRRLLKQAEESSVVDTEGDSYESGGAVSSGGVAVQGKSAHHRSRKTEFHSHKLDELERDLSDFKAALRQGLSRSKYDCAFVLIDDFYLLPRDRQPDIIDYLHRLLRGTEVYMKVGTVRHRSTLIRQDNQTIGVELHQDAEEINLDRTLEDVDATSEYLGRMLEALASAAGVEDPKNNLFNPEAFGCLVLASGGVPRDFLNILVEAVDSALAEGQTRWLTPTNVWKGASRVSYRTKVNNLRSDAESDASPLEKMYRDLVRFCLKEKRKTGFLISEEEAQAHPDMHEMIHQLMDFKLVHVVEPDTSAASGRKGRFEAYTLDFSLFMEPRMRNIEHIEFWRTDADRRRVGLREAPDYSLERARRALADQDQADIESVLEEANQDRE